MKKGQICEGKVYKYSFPNKGYVKIEDRDICVKGALLGQQVRFSVKRLKKGAGEGRLLEVMEKSELEDVEAQCPHFGMCGGCAYQTLSYENQLRLKGEQVKNILSNAILTVDNNVDNVDNVDKWWEGIKQSPVTCAYRNKMEYSFGDEYKDGPLSLGMHRKGDFHDIVTVDKCTIVDDDYNKIIRLIRDFYEEKEVTFYKKMQHVGVLRHLVVRQSASNKDILVNLVTTTRDDLSATNVVAKTDLSDECIDEKQLELSQKLYLDELCEKLLALDLHGKITGILHTWNDSLSDAVVPQNVITLYGRDYIYEEILGLKFKISPFSFFQTNTRSAEVLYETARSYVMSMGAMAESDGKSLLCDDAEDNDTGSSQNDADDRRFKNKVIFDLYSGTGTIAQMMAPVAKKVVGIEIVEEAVEAAKENAELNGLTNCEFIAGDVLKMLDEVKEKPDIIILDPPRDGCNPKALDRIVAHIRAKHIVYISCKPTSLARDLIVMQQHGYKVLRACAVDQFPGTLHVETVVGLQRIDM